MNESERSSRLALRDAGYATESKTCGDVGCEDGASLAIHPDDSSWMDGAYQLTLQADNDTFTCGFRIPDDLPGDGSPPMIECTPKLSVYFGQDSQCMLDSEGNPSSGACTKIPDRYTLQMEVPGTPASVAVALERDGSAQIQERGKPAYQDSYPNGPECGSVCKRASLGFEWCAL